jgi:putative addiction module killer protein
MQLDKRIQLDTMAFMLTFHRTAQFDAWLKSLKDRSAKTRIVLRVRKAEAGHFGVSKPVGEGVSELRIDAGPGYRIYYARRGEVVYLLLLGGDKSSQAQDIQNAIAMNNTLKEQNP